MLGLEDSRCRVQQKTLGKVAMSGRKQQVSVLAVLEVAFRQRVNLFLWSGDSR